MPAEDLREGVQGKGSKWKNNVNTDQSEQNYESGANSESANQYEQNASNAGSTYAAGLAEYLGVDEDEIATESSYTSGVQDAGSEWQQGVSQSGQRWRSGVQQADENEWEENTAAASDKWFDNFRKGATGER